MHINPDHFLDTPTGRVVTPERNARAWDQCFAALPVELAKAGASGVLYVLVGAQGSGKSTWARERKAQEPGAVIFDAILVKISERAPILARAREHGVPSVAVWFCTPLEVCVARNAARPPDLIANEQGLRNVFAAVEPPTEAEGFARILIIEQGAACSRRSHLLRLAAVVLAAVPVIFGLIRAISTGADFRYLWLAAAALVGSLAVMGIGYAGTGSARVSPVRAVGAVAAGAACAAGAAIVQGATAGPGVAIVAVAFGLCTGTSAVLGTLSRRRRTQ